MSKTWSMAAQKETGWTTPHNFMVKAKRGPTRETRVRQEPRPSEGRLASKMLTGSYSCMPELDRVLGKRILLVDDDQGARESIKLLLNIDRHNVVEARNGQEALEV